MKEWVHKMRCSRCSREYLGDATTRCPDPCGSWAATVVPGASHVIELPEGAGMCLKQVVVATVVAVDGRRFVATNHVLDPQLACPRAGMKTGEGYELCRDVCKQPAHAEVNALALAGDAARGGSLRLDGHTYACEPCIAAARAAGILTLHIEGGASFDLQGATP